MKTQQEALRAAFALEANDRLARASEELQAHLDGPALDRLHQEFDSLFGAARAVNCRSTERVARTCAELARWLRREQAGAAGPDVDLLRQGMTILEKTVGTGTPCDEQPVGEDIQGFLEAVQQRTE